MAMGNTQSSEFDSDRPPPVALTSDQAVDHSGPMVNSPIGANCNKQDARKQLKDSLFGLNVNDVGPELLPKQPSVDYPLALSSKPSSPHSSSHTSKDGCALRVGEVAALLQEVRKTATAEDLDILQKALQPHKDEGEKLPARKASGSRSDRPSTTMTRRSSLFRAIPGTATRRNTLRKQPPSQKARKHKPQTWSPDMFIQSPLTTIASLSSANREVKADAVRSTTPCPDYPQLGVHELGSLRVINGAVSPQPSINSNLTPLSHETSSKASDYFGAVQKVEGKSGSGLETITQEKSPSTSSDISITGLPDTPTMSVDTAVEEIIRESPGESSPSSTWPQASRLRRVKAAKPLTEAHTARMALYSVEASSNPFLSSPTETYRKQSIEGIGLNRSNHDPFASSQQTELDSLQHPNDRSIYSDHTPAGRTTETAQESRAEALKALNGDSTGSSSYTARSTELSSYGSDCIEPGTASGSPTTQGKENLPIAQKMDEPADNTARNEFVDDHSRIIDMKSAPQLRPTIRRLDLHQQSPPPLIVTLAKPKTLEPISGVSGKTSSANAIQSNATNLSPIRPAHESTASSTTEQTKGDTKSQSRKLVKKRATSERNLRASIVVQGQSELGEVPRIPAEVAAKHSDRMSKNPKMEHLEHTYDSVSTCDTRPASPAAEQLQDVEIRFPSPAPSVEGSPASKRGRKSQKRRSIGPSSSPHSLFSRKSSKSGERRKSLNGDDDPDFGTAGLTNLGTVTESLGSSPYDIAMAGFGTSTPRSKSIAATHPHQMSSSMPRPKSMVGMDEKAATEWAFKRSKDRLEQASPKSTHHTRHKSSPQPNLGPVTPPLMTVLTERPSPPPMHRQDQSVRPKTIHEDIVHRMIPSPYSSSLDLLGSTDSNEKYGSSSSSANKDQANASLNANIDPSWQMQAKLWRQRRKSIGEGLQSARIKIPHDENDSPLKEPQTPFTPTNSTPLFLTPLTPMTSATDLTSEVGMRKDTVPRKCPSPTVRERAQYFEAEAARQREDSRSPSPERRAFAERVVYRGQPIRG